MDPEAKYPPNTVSLPFTCADRSCACQHRLEPHLEVSAMPIQRHGRWDVEVRALDRTLDVFSAYPTLNDALTAVHAEYPAARFDPDKGHVVYGEENE